MWQLMFLRGTPWKKERKETGNGLPFFWFRDQEFLQSQKRQTISRLFPLLFSWLSILRAKLHGIGQEPVF